jgi:hypothetical protein
MEAVSLVDASVSFDIYTTVPRWFFRQSITQTFGYHSVLTDIGYVQKSPLRGDQEATLKALDKFLPLTRESVDGLAERLKSQLCQMVVCDISPLGIAAAVKAGIPSVLIENFTWDWIYEGLDPRFEKHNSYLKDTFDKATYHIQTEPVCQRHTVDLSVGPISRAPRRSRSRTRKELGVSDSTKLILVGMGGVKDQYDFVKAISIPSGCCIIFPGASSKAEIYDNLILLPHSSDYFHPDLIHACDAAVGKAGYSTIAEIYAAGIPCGYILRKDSRESPVLQQFIKRQMSSIEIDAHDFRTGKWVQCLHNLLSLPVVRRSQPNSAEKVARTVLKWTSAEK